MSKQTKQQIKHTKHTKLIKPIGGDFHAEEWGIIGAPCSVIKALASTITEHFQNSLRIGFIDAAHHSTELDSPYEIEYIDKISHQSFSFDIKPSQKQYRKFFNDLDLLLVNSNHFAADKQIVILDERKKDSLSRKLDKLKEVRMVLTQDRNEEIYPFLKPHLSESVCVFDINDVASICAFIREEMHIPKLFGLVLAGGKSLRMGNDKGQIEYYGKPHREYSCDMISAFCQKVFISLRSDQGNQNNNRYDILKDSFIGLGPYGALLSAFREFPNHAWLTIACDLPFLDSQTIKQLTQARNPSKLATCFHNESTNFPEPLITIWEPKAYPVLLEYLSQGYSCPRKVLINSNIEELHIDNQLVLSNVNDQKSYQETIKKIANKK